MVGSVVGTIVGIKLGKTDGIELGTNEGNCDGPQLGRGVKEGTFVGENDGA